MSIALQVCGNKGELTTLFSSTLTLSASFASPVAAGNSVMVTLGVDCEWFSHSAVPFTISVSDDQGNTYAADVSNIPATTVTPGFPSRGIGIGIFRASSIGNAPQAITVTANFPTRTTGGVAANLYFTAGEYAQTGAVTVDASGANSDQTLQTSIATSSLTTTNADDLLIAGVWDDWGDSTRGLYGVSSGYSLEGQQQSSDKLTVAMAAQTLSATGTYAATFSFTGTGSQLQFSAIAAYRGFGAPPPPSLDCDSPPTGTVGIPYSHSLLASGGAPPYASYAITAGSLPAGLSLNSLTGLISGTPTVPTTPGAASFTARVTDSAAATGSVSCSITILPTSLSICQTPPPIGQTGTAYSFTFATPTYASTPITWSLLSGSLPTGLTMASGGAMSGTPTVAGVFSFQVQLTDSAGITASTSVLHVEITPPDGTFLSAIAVSDNASLQPVLTPVQTDGTGVSSDTLGPYEYGGNLYAFICDAWNHQIGVWKSSGWRGSSVGSPTWTRLTASVDCFFLYDLDGLSQYFDTGAGQYYDVTRVGDVLYITYAKDISGFLAVSAFDLTTESFTGGPWVSTSHAYLTGRSVAFDADGWSRLRAAYFNGRLVIQYWGDSESTDLGTGDGFGLWYNTFDLVTRSFGTPALVPTSAQNDTNAFIAPGPVLAIGAQCLLFYQSTASVSPNPDLAFLDTSFTITTRTDTGQGGGNSCQASVIKFDGIPCAAYLAPTADGIAYAPLTNLVSGWTTSTFGSGIGFGLFFNAGLCTTVFLFDNSTPLKFGYTTRSCGSWATPTWLFTDASSNAGAIYFASGRQLPDGSVGFVCGLEGYGQLNKPPITSPTGRSDSQGRVYFWNPYLPNCAFAPVTVKPKKNYAYIGGVSLSR